MVIRSTQIKTYSWDNAQVLLVGNKCDMDDERVVASERGRQLSEHLGKFVFFRKCNQFMNKIRLCPSSLQSTLVNGGYIRL